jgi:glyoxylase-like metal-dependent hydrolase (beta-lactamase superfamily II)
LPGNPLEHVNSYLIKSAEKNLLIDTGMDFPQTFQSLCDGLSEAGVRPEELTDVLCTHFHVDHVGLIPRFTDASKNVKISLHHVEVEMSRLMSRELGSYVESMKAYLEANGAPPFMAASLERFHPAFFTPRAYQEIGTRGIVLEDGQRVSVGDYSFQILWTPGHSPGHVCLYEPSSEILFSGDHLLPTITPHVSQFLEDMDPLTDYLNSLQRIAEIDVDVVLPGHEETFSNHRVRIKQLNDHHKQRLSEIIDGLEIESSTAYQLASKLHWSVDYKSWEEFPPFQKYLAVGETIAHLNFLERRGRVKRNKINKIIFYDVMRTRSQNN